MTNVAVPVPFVKLMEKGICSQPYLWDLANIPANQLARVSSRKTDCKRDMTDP